MKKVLYFISSISIILLIIICLMINNKQKIVLMDNHIEKNVSSKMISMMYETEAGSGIYQETTDTIWPSEGYAFNERLSKCENGSLLSWDDESKRVMVFADESDKCYVYFDIKIIKLTFADYITSLYIIDGVNGLYLHDADLENGAGDNSLRYAGANPDNYVCFGSDAETCPTDNLYRIIGVFDNKVKIIKYDYATSDLLGTDGDYKGIGSYDATYYKGSQTTSYRYYWNNSTQTNIWGESQLNTINLNTNYINNIGNNWASKISTTTWSVGGMDYSSTDTVKQCYDGEMTYGTAYSAKIGLMYVSEYGYAASPSYWATELYYYDEGAYNEDWMFMGGYDWTISRYSAKSHETFGVDYTGYVEYDSNVLFSYGVRPTFYLDSSIVLIGGSGTISNPFRIS